jgi:PBP1b-binding outer membrane lipoprotein LpoB
MNFSWISRSMLLSLVLVLGLGMLFAGCSKKAEIETDPEMPADTTEVQEVPPPPTPEPEPVKTTPDYASMDPSEFGVEDVFFAFDQYELDGEAMSTLSRNA